QAVALDPLPDRVAVAVEQLPRQRALEPLGLARLPAQVLLRLAQLLDLPVRQPERVEQTGLGHLVRARLDHRQRVARADDDQVELAGLLALLERGVDDELAV